MEREPRRALVPLLAAGEIPLRGIAAVEAGQRTPEEVGMRYRKVRVYAGPSLVDQFRKRLAACKTADEVQALHLDICRDKASQVCSSGTRRKFTRLAAARIDAIREERIKASAAKPLIVAPW